jgi:glycosyltransferase involved in cell wall biosynthesis
VRAVIVSRLYADPAARGKLRALAALGCAVGAVVPSEWRSFGDGAVRATEFGDDVGARILPVPVRRGGRGEELRWQAAALRRSLAEFRPDIVQLEEEPTTPVAAQVVRAARRLRFRVISFGWESLPVRTSWVTRFRRTRVLYMAQGLIGGNRLALDLLLRDRPGVPHAVIPQTGVIPPLGTEHRPREGLSIGFVGRIVPEKGLDILFRACVRLQGSWRVHVIGSGEAQEELESLAARLGIAARVTWHGALPRSSLDALWPTLDCVAVPSRSTERWIETRGTSALSAMAHALPVVATAAGALPELVGGTGLTVPEDDVDGLAAALQQLHDDPALRARLGAEGRRRVLAEHTDPAIAQQTLAFWRTVLAFASS